MTFDLDVGQILQYGYNMLSSFLPVIYLFVGAAFALFVIGKLIAMARNNEGKS